jgi:hypothetical protein
MSYCSVLVCVDDPRDLEAAIAPFDGDLEVPPYRDYAQLEGKKPADFWRLRILREEFGLNADEGTLTWEQVAAANNRSIGWPEDLREMEGEFGGLSADEPMGVDEQGRPYLLLTSNPNRHFDPGYEIGGYWQGHFLAKPQAPEEHLVRGQPHWGTTPVTDPRHCAGGRKDALDLAGMRAAELIVNGGRRCASFVVVGTAMITLDGRWLGDCYGLSPDYCEEANAVVDRLPDKAWMIIIDVHF